MPNIIRYPLRNISPEKISDLQEKYPNASVQIELSDSPVQGGLGEADFWALIEQLDWQQIGHDDEVIEPVVRALSQGPLRHIYDFKDMLSQKLYLLDTAAHAQQIGKGSFSANAADFSADGFLFARCCAVANGREQYEAIHSSESRKYAKESGICPAATHCQRSTPPRTRNSAPVRFGLFRGDI